MNINILILAFIILFVLYVNLTQKDSLVTGVVNVLFGLSLMLYFSIVILFKKVSWKYLVLSFIAVYIGLIIYVRIVNKNV